MAANKGLLKGSKWLLSCELSGGTHVDASPHSTKLLVTSIWPHKRALKASERGKDPARAQNCFSQGRPTPRAKQTRPVAPIKTTHQTSSNRKPPCPVSPLQPTATNPRERALQIRLYQRPDAPTASARIVVVGDERYGPRDGETGRPRPALTIGPNVNEGVVGHHQLVEVELVGESFALCLVENPLVVIVSVNES